MLAHLDDSAVGPGMATDVLACLPMLRSGDVIDGRYRLIEPLASGGMGAVWRAMHTELSVEVALKVMLNELAATPSGEARFRREAQAAARLRSPHVVHVTDFGVADGQPYLAMELLQGEDLQQRLEKRGRLSLREAAAVLDGVAKAIQLAHGGQIIHRDLKPANIFLAQDEGGETVKVLDFGVAKVGGPGEPGKTTGSGLVGSPSYMSPEQVWAEPVSASTDIWSLAVVAYEMVTGVNPFDAPSLAKTFELIVRHDLPHARDAVPDLPDSVDEFFVRALERDPERRFASATELSSAFHDAIAGVALGSQPPIAVVQSKRSVDPNGVTVAESLPQAKRSFRAPVIAAALGLAGLGVYLFVASSPADRPSGGSATSPANAAPSAAAGPSSARSTASAEVPPTASATADASASAEPAPSLKATAPKITAVVSTRPTATATAPARTASAQPSVHPKFGIPRAPPSP